MPTWYEVDEDGLLNGEPDATVLEVCHRQKLPVMPIIALFNKKKFHELSGNQVAWARMNEAMVREASCMVIRAFNLTLKTSSGQIAMRLRHW